MRVFFDYQTFSQQSYGGISRYFCELINGINQTGQHEAHLSLLWSNNVHLNEYNIKKLKYPFPRRHRLLQFSNQVFNYIDSKTSQFDIFHATYYDPYFIPILHKQPFVVTFHDMIYEKFGAQFKGLGNNLQIVSHKRLLAEMSNRIIAVSHSAKEDIVNLLNVDPDKIDVVYHGCSFTYRCMKEGNNIEPYILFVGNRENYKNFRRFARAISLVLRRNDLKLVCAGGGSLTKDELVFLDSVGLSLHVRQVPISSDDKLQSLYESAHAFVFPSLYEGFGMPILEAFVCSCPCVISNVSSLPEVAGDAALYFDPTDEESIANAVERIITDEQLRAELVEAGRSRVSLFSWSRSVQETLNVYDTCIRM